VNLTRENLDYGSNIIGGVTPGRRGRDVHGVPVFDSVAQLVNEVGQVPDGSVVTVPPTFTRDALVEAIEAGGKLIGIVTGRARRPDGGAAGHLAQRERGSEATGRRGTRRPPADRRLHGRPLHGRDARDELRPRRHNRGGQGRHRGREDQAARVGGHHGGRGDL